MQCFGRKVVARAGHSDAQAVMLGMPQSDMAAALMLDEKAAALDARIQSSPVTTGTRGDIVEG